MKLDDAVRALRDEGALAPQRKRAIRERVLAKPRPSKKIVVWVLPIAAALVASSVWASVSGHWFSPPPPVTEPDPVPVETAPPRPPPIVTTVAPVPAPSVAESVSAMPAPKPVPAEDRSLLAYREAERLQRVEKDCARAVPAWDAYLAQAGSSPLAVDARFSRAICLVRLGRADEARSALAPFARGESGSYRQSEAQSLLDALNGDSSAGN